MNETAAAKLIEAMGTIFAPTQADGLPYLLTREAAEQRYSLSQRQFDKLYRKEDFPVIWLGKTVLILRQQADQWFADRVGCKIDIG